MKNLNTFDQFINESLIVEGKMTSVVFRNKRYLKELNLKVNWGSDPEEASLSLRLLSDIREVFFGEFISTRDLLERLREIEEAPWAYMERFNPSVLAH
jgi:hypothetical protein